MKKENIALFKKFLVHKELNNVFAIFYDKYHDLSYDKNVDDYLRKVDAHDVIAKAFPRLPLEINNIYDRRFWNDYHLRWLANLAAANFTAWYNHGKNGENIDRIAALVLDEAIDKITVDVPRYCDPKSAGMIYQDKLLELRGKPENLPYAVSEPAPISTTAGGAKVQENENKQPKTANEMNNKNVTSSTFKFFDISLGGNHRTTKGVDVISVNTRGGSYKVTFYAAVAKEVAEAGLEYLRIGQDEFTGDVRVVFGKEPVGVKWIGNKRSDGTCSSIVINNKALALLLKKLFKHEGEDVFELRISPNLARVDDYKTYQISNIKQKRL